MSRSRAGLTACAVCHQHRRGRLSRCVDLATGYTETVCDKGYCLAAMAVRHPLRRIEPHPRIRCRPDCAHLLTAAAT